VADPQISGHFRAIPAANLAGCHEGDAIKTEHMVERRFQMLDAMRQLLAVGERQLRPVDLSW